MFENNDFAVLLRTPMLTRAVSSEANGADRYVRPARSTPNSAPSTVGIDNAIDGEPNHPAPVSTTATGSSA